MGLKENDMTFKGQIKDTIRFIADFADLVKTESQRLNSPIVALGRDAWVIVPYLRYHGCNCQYFHFSRLQLDDKSTEKQWMAEVPPHSIIVDTGFKGTIPDNITDFDDTVRGVVLMCSASDGYFHSTAIHSNISHNSIVDIIEYSTKLTPRCVGYNNGIAKYNKNEEDDSGRVKPERAAPRNYTLLRELGLPQTVAHQYATFTGTTPEERIGVKTSHQVKKHCDKVTALRKHTNTMSLMPDDIETLIRSSHKISLKEFDFEKLVRENPFIIRQNLNFIDSILRREQKKIIHLRKKLENLAAWKEDERQDIISSIDRKERRVHFCCKLLYHATDILHWWYKWR